MAKISLDYQKTYLKGSSTYHKKDGGNKDSGNWLNLIVLSFMN